MADRVTVRVMKSPLKDQSNEVTLLKNGKRKVFTDGAIFECDPNDIDGLIGVTVQIITPELLAAEKAAEEAKKAEEEARRLAEEAALKAVKANKPEDEVIGAADQTDKKKAVKKVSADQPFSPGA